MSKKLRFLGPETHGLQIICFKKINEVLFYCHSLKIFLISFASMHGIPVVSRDGEAFPNNTYTDASTVYNITVPSSNDTVSWVLEEVMPGSMLVMAVMPKPDSRIKQKVRN